VHRSGFAGQGSLKRSWGYNKQTPQTIEALHSATALLSLVQERFRRVQIDCRPFECIIPIYEQARTFFYCSTPYFDVEDYYVTPGVPRFTLADHERLAQLLNATPAKVALSYYEHPRLASLYPQSRWRRMTWSQAKASDKRAEKSRASEVLLMKDFGHRIANWGGQ